MQVIEYLQWRYATKKYDPNNPVLEDDLHKIKEAIRLSASSYGLQLFKVLDIRSTELRQQLKKASWGQAQITDASHLLLFCNYETVDDEHIEAYAKRKAEVQGVDVDVLQGYTDFVKSKIKAMSPETVQTWTAKQTYIGLANGLMACAELHIDSTPMEGFEPHAYEEILGLKEKGLKAAVALAIGYRSKKDEAQHAKKVRKPLDVLFETIG